MNPPYGREIERWMRKAFESSREGALVVSLVPARTIHGGGTNTPCEARSDICGDVYGSWKLKTRRRFRAPWSFSGHPNAKRSSAVCKDTVRFIEKAMLRTPGSIMLGSRETSSGIKAYATSAGH